MTDVYGAPGTTLADAGQVDVDAPRLAAAARATAARSSNEQPAASPGGSLKSPAAERIQM